MLESFDVYRHPYHLRIPLVVLLYPLPHDFGIARYSVYFFHRLLVKPPHIPDPRLKHLALEKWVSIFDEMIKIVKRPHYGVFKMDLRVIFILHADVLSPVPRADDQIVIG